MFAKSANKSLFTLTLPSLRGHSFVLNTLRHEEGISRSDAFDINLSASDGIIPSELLNQVCHISWDWDGVEQDYHGLVTGFILAPDTEGNSNYRLTVESPLVVLKNSYRHRHFIHKTLKGIVKEVIDSSGAKLLSTEFHLSAPDPERDYTAQHGESDLSFLERILHESAWFYTLIHSESGVTLHVYDHSYALPTLPSSVLYQPLAQGTKSSESLYEISVAKQEITSPQVKAKSDCLGMRAGLVFSLSGHPNQELNQSYIIVSVTHEIDEKSEGLRYKNTLHLLPAKYQYRPDFQPHTIFINTIGMSQIHSKDEAPLLSENGEYILKSPYTDELTHPIRASTLYSGEDYGLHFPLHAEAQVLVAYLNGHPDKPVVLGSLFNDAHRNVVNAENARQNRLVTQSGHTLLLDDTPAHQKILLHTPEQDHRLLLDATTDDEKIELISETGEMQVDISKSTLFKTEDHFTLTADQSISMTAQENVSFASDEAHLSCEAAQDIVHRAGQDISWHADQDLAIRVDGNSETTVQQSMRTDIQDGDYLLKVGAGSLTQQVQNNIQLSTASGDIILKTAQASVSFMADGSVIFNAKKIILQAQSIDIHNAGETKEN
jgi:type VI secretion system secreted protein VgrG